MVTVHRIRLDTSAPILAIETPGVGTFDGAEKAGHSRKLPFVGKLKQPVGTNRQFYAVAPPGALAVPSVAWVEPNSMYYCCEMSGELLAIETEQGFFQAINPLTVVPRPREGDAPCVVDQFFAPIIRIEGLDPTQLFCIEGNGGRDEFKLIYDELGFRGLVFEEVWRGES